MSKMSQLHAALAEQAAELGFENIRQAEEAGFVVDCNTCSLVKEGWSAQDQAHAAWLKEKEGVLNELYNLSTTLEMTTHLSTEPVKKAIKFIEGAKHE